MSGLPEMLARLVAPWMAAVAEADPTEAHWLREQAEVRPMQIRDWTAPNPTLEAALDEARRTTIALANHLDRVRDPYLPTVAEAQASLERLVEVLQAARPSDGKRALGLGW